ncbi:GID complex subunit containing RING finger motif [Zygosaccharomyces mellis]|uniref:GID complex subunit containing RING finger motif n=1 Tax=Zygosaccharomyces mellis TaxID=42258 RepID=A0A4C2E1B4_9SACH|nr:GID complex subunit containing RING finger motif [Zygosaccharomyces mellis]
MGSLFNEPSTDFHLQLNEQLFQIPYELLRKNSKLVQKVIDKEAQGLNNDFQEMNAMLVKNELEQDKVALVKLGEIIKSVDSFEKKLGKRTSEDLQLLNRIKERITFFQNLEDAKTLRDHSKLTQWYQDYTNLLIGDYLIRNSRVKAKELDEARSGEDESEDDKSWNPGVMFLKQQHLEQLLDYDILLAANRISKSLTEEHNLSPLITWIGENQSFLKKNCSILEFEVRLQEYVEYLKNGQFKNAIECFQRFLLQFMETNFADLKLASGLLVFIKSCEKSSPPTSDGFIDPQIIAGDEFAKDGNLVLKSKADVHQHFFHRKAFKSPNTPVSSNVFKLNNLTKNLEFARYTDLLDTKRWVALSELFLKEYYSMYGISHLDPLLMYLSLGISTLKTKECLHEQKFTSSNFHKLNDFIHQGILRNTCPVCSSEFAPIAKDLPYAHHTQSKLFENPIMLPNGNIYDMRKLKTLAATLIRENLYPLKDYEVLDPIDKQVFAETDFVTMYPT